MEKITDVVKKAKVPKIDVENVKNSLGNVSSKASGAATAAIGKAKGFFRSNTSFSLIVIGLLFIILILIVIY